MNLYLSEWGETQKVCVYIHLKNVFIIHIKINNPNIICVLSDHLVNEHTRHTK